MATNENMVYLAPLAFVVMLCDHPGIMRGKKVEPGA